MPELNEQNGMHEADITWADYKSIIAAGGYEPDKIYFIEDLSSQSEALKDLLTTMNQLKTLINSHT